MENEAPSNRTTTLPSDSTNGTDETLGSGSTPRQTNISRDPSSSTCNWDITSLSQNALLSGDPEIESESIAPFSSQVRAQLRAISLLTLFDSADSILPLLRIKSPDVVETFKDFCQLVSYARAKLPQFPDTLRMLADEFDVLLKGEAAQRCG